MRNRVRYFGGGSQRWLRNVHREGEGGGGGGDNALAAALAESQEALKKAQKQLANQAQQLKSFSGIDLEALQAAAAELAERDEQTEIKGKNWEKLLEKAKTDLAALREEKDKEISNLRGELDSGSVENALRSVLGPKCVPALLESAVALLKSGSEVVEVDGQRVAMWGSQNAEELVKQWSESDVGKHFTLARQNSGGGTGSGQTHSGGSDKKLQTAIDMGTRGNPAFNLTNFARLKNDDPETYQRAFDEIQKATSQPSGLYPSGY